MIISELKDILEVFNTLKDYETLNVYINNKKVFLENIKLISDNGYANLFLEVKDCE